LTVLGYLKAWFEKTAYPGYEYKSLISNPPPDMPKQKTGKLLDFRKDSLLIFIDEI